MNRRVLTLLVFIVAAIAAAMIWNTGRRGDNVLVVYVSHDQVFSEPILKDFERDTGITVRALYDTRPEVVQSERRSTESWIAPRAHSALQTVSLGGYGFEQRSHSHELHCVSGYSSALWRGEALNRRAAVARWARSILQSKKPRNAGPLLFLAVAYDRWAVRVTSVLLPPPLPLAYRAVR